jgi:hypothetical protein
VEPSNVTDNHFLNLFFANTSGYFNQNGTVNDLDFTHFEVHGSPLSIGNELILAKNESTSTCATAGERIKVQQEVRRLLNFNQITGSVVAMTRHDLVSYLKLQFTKTYNVSLTISVIVYSAALNISVKFNFPFMLSNNGMNRDTFRVNTVQKILSTPVTGINPLTVAKALVGGAEAAAIGMAECMKETADDAAAAAAENKKSVISAASASAALTASMKATAQLKLDAVKAYNKETNGVTAVAAVAAVLANPLATPPVLAAPAVPAVEYYQGIADINQDIANASSAGAAAAASKSAAIAIVNDTSNAGPADC